MDQTRMVAYSIIFWITCLNVSCGLVIPKEQGIVKEILKDYNSDVKPDGDINNTITVKLDVSVLKLNELNVKSQVLSIHTITTLRWFDDRLKWNKSEHHNIDNLSIGNTLIWTPDIVLFNDAESSYTLHTDLYKTKVHVTHNGMVAWVATVIWSASCEVDVTWFPIDRQVCSLTFGSLSYHSKQMAVELHEKPKNILGFLSKSDRNFVQSGEWEVKDIATTEQNHRLPCCKNEFSTVLYTIALERFSQFYFLYILFPIVSQFFLFLIIFHIPTDSGERLGFGITILLNITMYMTFISTKLPEKSNNKPLLGLIFATLFFVSSLGLAMSAVTSFFSRRETSVPKWLRKLLCLKKRRKKSINNNCYIKENNMGIAESSADPDVIKLEDVPIAAIEDFRKGICHKKEGNDDEDITWSLAMRTVDKYLFYVFLFLMLLLPIIIGITLSTTKLGSFQNLFF